MGRPPIPADVKARIVAMLREEKTPGEVLEALANDGIEVSKTTVYGISNHMKTFGGDVAA